LPAAASLLFSACQSEPAAGSIGVPFETPLFGDPFWDHWGDGRAEMAGYELTMPRYGELRKGTAVTIFVTETFSNELRVKANPGNHPPEDEFSVMKLNLVEDFPTGIYDYNWMTSSFIALEPVNSRPAGLPAKVSFTGQEWCGHVYSHFLFDPDAIRHVLHSYFDGEADQRNTLPYPADGLGEDALWFWARGLAGPRLEPSQSTQIKLLTALKFARARHEDPGWTDATLSRAAQPEEITVPAGAFTVERWKAEKAGGAARTFYVEAEPPHRIIRWETSEGEEAALLGSERLAYWEMNANEYVSALEKLGLSPRPPRTP